MCEVQGGMVRTWCITPHPSTVHAQQQAQRKIRQLEHAKSKSPARLRSLCPSAPTLRACACPAGPLQAGSMGPLPHGLLRLGAIRSGGWSSKSTIGVKGVHGAALICYKSCAAPCRSHLRRSSRSLTITSSLHSSSDKCRSALAGGALDNRWILSLSSPRKGLPSRYLDTTKGVSRNG